jgi:hypothetical protein
LNRQETIHEKGFAMGQDILNYGKIKVGISSLDDAVLNLNSLKGTNKNYHNKSLVMKALADRDVKTIREISNYFYRTNGIYFRVCNYFASMYRYDWYIVPEIYDLKTNEDKVIKEFTKILNYLDNS